MGAPPDVLSFRIYVSARFGALDTKAKFHHVMRVSTCVEHVNPLLKESYTLNLICLK